MKEKMILGKCCKEDGCNERQLGALVKCMTLAKLDPSPAKPYHGICIIDLQSLIPKYERLAERRLSAPSHGREYYCREADWLTGVKRLFEKPLSLDSN